MSEGPLIDIRRPIIPLKLDFAQKLFDNIPSSVVDRWKLKKPEKGWNTYPIFRFNKQKLSTVYLGTASADVPNGHVMIKYSLPDFKFEYIYPDEFKKSIETDSEGRQIERRYDKDGNAESEYIKVPCEEAVHHYLRNQKYIYVKIKSKGKKVYLPYTWANKTSKTSKPIDNIDEIRPYLIENPTRFEWFHKQNNPEDIYVVFLLSTLAFKQNK